MSVHKPHLSVAVIGHQQCGKSTLIGHLLCLCGAIDEHAMELNKQTALELALSRFSHWGWEMDKLKAERERGTTIEVKTRKMETPSHVFSIIDVPGHRDFIKNTITGLSMVCLQFHIPSMNCVQCMLDVFGFCCSFSDRCGNHFQI